MNRALIIVDYTVDFVAADGALSCGPPAVKIESAITGLAKSFIERGDYVVFAVDVHEPDDELHPESKLFPPHNIAGAGGRKLYGALEAVYTDNRNKPNVYYMDKTRYSAFAGTDLLLRLRQRRIDELHFAGVCTDICVLHSMVDAYNMGFSLVAHEKCMASFSETGHAWAIGHFRGCLGAAIQGC